VLGTGISNRSSSSMVSVMVPPGMARAMMRGGKIAPADVLRWAHHVCR
jgi:hypothetical protein